MFFLIQKSCFDHRNVCFVQDCNHTEAWETLENEKPEIYCLKQGSTEMGTEKHEIYCLQYSLKLLTLRSFVGNEVEMRITKYFLKSAKVLKEIRICTDESYNAEILKKLLMLPRCSETCQIAVLEM